MRLVSGTELGSARALDLKLELPTWRFGRELDEVLNGSGLGFRVCGLGSLCLRALGHSRYRVGCKSRTEACFSQNLLNLVPAELPEIV